MRILSVLAALLLTLGSGAGATAPASLRPSSPAAPQRLPDRMLSCTLARATNVDLTREQPASELVMTGSHVFKLFLPSRPVMQGPPPEARDAPEPVPAGTRIVSDPDRLARNAGLEFDRVVDVWPDRVELATTLAPRLFHLIIVHPIDVVAGTARLLMTTTDDTMTFDRDHIYIGDCKIDPGALPPAQQQPRK